MIKSIQRTSCIAASYCTVAVPGEHISANTPLCSVRITTRLVEILQLWLSPEWSMSALSWRIWQPAALKANILFIKIVDYRIKQGWTRRLWPSKTLQLVTLKLNILFLFSFVGIKRSLPDLAQKSLKCFFFLQIDFRRVYSHASSNLWVWPYWSVGWLVSPPLWSRLKYPNNYYCHGNWYRHRCFPEDEA